MTSIEDGGPAFPSGVPGGGPARGMSLRDYIAISAMAAMIPSATTYVGVVNTAYGYADAMIARRAQES